MRTTHQKKTKEKKYLLGRLCQLASTRSTVMRLLKHRILVCPDVFFALALLGVLGFRCLNPNNIIIIIL
jgi:hypothetical protein